MRAFGIRLLASLREHLRHPGTRRVAGNTVWLLVDRVLRLAVGFLVGVWVARYLGPAQYGQLNYAIAFASLFGAFATLGTDDVIVRDLVRFPDRADAILATGTAIRIGGSILVTATIFAASLLVPFREPETRTLVVIVALAFLFRPFDIIELWFQAETNSRPAILAKNLIFLGVSAGKLLLVYTGASVVAFGVLEPVYAGLAAFLVLVAYRLYGRRLTIRGANWADTRALFRDSWPLLLGGIAISVYMRIDQVMLETLLGARGSTEVGIYSAALRLSEAWYFLPSSIVASLLPTLVLSKKAGEALYLDRLQRLFSLLAAIALAVAIPMTFLSGHVIRLAFGAAFAGAGPVLAIHIWTTLFVFWGVAGATWMLNEGLLRLALYRSIAAALLNVALNFALIPRHGAVGAALATLAAQACGTCFFHLTDRRTRRLFQIEMRSLALKGLVQ